MAAVYRAIQTAERIAVPEFFPVAVKDRLIELHRLYEEGNKLIDTLPKDKAAHKAPPGPARLSNPAYPTSAPAPPALHGNCSSFLHGPPPAPQSTRPSDAPGDASRSLVNHATYPLTPTSNSGGKKREHADVETVVADKPFTKRKRVITGFHEAEGNQAEPTLSISAVLHKSWPRLSNKDWVQWFFDWDESTLPLHLTAPLVTDPYLQADAEANTKADGDTSSSVVRVTGSVDTEGDLMEMDPQSRWEYGPEPTSDRKAVRHRRMYPQYFRNGKYLGPKPTHLCPNKFDTLYEGRKTQPMNTPNQKRPLVQADAVEHSRSDPYLRCVSDG